MSTTFLYARCSTLDQSVAHQLTMAEAAGFMIDQVIADEGVSGVSTRLAERPQARRLYDLLRAGDVLVVRWIDRLGRNFDDVTSVIREFIGRGVIIKTVINGMVFDGSTQDPVQKAVRDALIAFLAAIGEAQHEATKASQAAGIALAKEKHPERFKGRKITYDSSQLETVQNLLSQGTGVSEVAAAVGLSRGTVYRIKRNPEMASAALERWQM